MLPLIPRLRRAHWERCMAAMCIAVELSADSLHEAKTHCLLALYLLDVPLPSSGEAAEGERGWGQWKLHDSKSRRTPRMFLLCGRRPVLICLAPQTSSLATVAPHLSHASLMLPQRSTWLRSGGATGGRRAARWPTLPRLCAVWRAPAGAVPAGMIL